VASPVDEDRLVGQIPVAHDGRDEIGDSLAFAQSSDGAVRLRAAPQLAIVGDHVALDQGRGDDVSGHAVPSPLLGEDVAQSVQASL
jgi:hypothetical protein